MYNVDSFRLVRIQYTLPNENIDSDYKLDSDEGFNRFHQRLRTFHLCSHPLRSPYFHLTAGLYAKSRSEEILYIALYAL
ncbi:unnamed protein product [Rhizophagus irregularis]|nr:unnamed protein product [Rhizophagus irregularis]